MKYNKPPLSFEQQADLLISRGMNGDRALMIKRLETVSYYRLSGYWFPFRKSHEDTLKPGVSFESVWKRYAFDRRLRLLVMDAIERIEVAVRTNLAHHHAIDYSPFAYAENPQSLPKLKSDEWDKFKQKVIEETKRSQEVFVKHFRDKYGDSHEFLPVWMVTEVMTFGTILTFYRYTSHKVKQKVASVFGMPERVFESWLLTLNTIRNICAHHGRLWNRELGIKPMIPRRDQYPDWHDPIKINQDRVFAVLTICRYCLSRIAPQSRWPERVISLLDQYPDIPRSSMGFPENWQECPIWKNLNDLDRGE